ncbi:MAG: hypothetical protein LBT25_02015 [Candidatus Symbiothrix sp.]|jgi:hypothetical protein|nr:hypothetical protein [Candidatus Symbiothrix sp.]
MEVYLKFSPFYFFCLYCASFIFFTFAFNYILYDDALFYKSFGEILGVDRINTIIEKQSFFLKISYFLIPIFLFLKIFFTSTCIATGVLISEQNLKFSQCFNIALKAEIVFLFELIIKINYFSILGVNSLEEINIRPFSVLQLLGNIEPWMSYPVSILNIYELTYWFFLALFFSNCIKKSFGYSLGFIAKTYGVGLLLWIVFVVYITLFLF